MRFLYQSDVMSVGLEEMKEVELCRERLVHILLEDTQSVYSMLGRWIHRRVVGVFLPLPLPCGACAWLRGYESSIVDCLSSPGSRTLTGAGGFEPSGRCAVWLAGVDSVDGRSAERCNGEADGVGEFAPVPKGDEEGKSSGGDSGIEGCWAGTRFTSELPRGRISQGRSRSTSSDHRFLEFAVCH